MLPVDYDDVTIVELEPGRRFVERSEMRWSSHWRHERIVDGLGDRRRLTDHLEVAPRRVVPPAVACHAMRSLVEHRHRRLAARLGVAD